MKSVIENVPCLEYSISINLLTFTQRIFQDTLSVNISLAKFDKFSASEEIFTVTLVDRSLTIKINEDKFILVGPSKAKVHRPDNG